MHDKEEDMHPCLYFFVSKCVMLKHNLQVFIFAVSALHVILLHIRNAALAIGCHVCAAGLGRFGLFKYRFHPGHNAFAHILFDVAAGQAETGVDRGRPDLWDKRACLDRSLE